MQNTSIEWCDHTFNPWEGCTKVSPGCVNCYAEARNCRWNGGTAPNWGKGKPRRRTSEANWRKPVLWNRRAAESNSRPRVFCASLADWLDDEVPIEWLADLLQLVRQTTHLDWLLLTKRPQNFSVIEVIHDEFLDGNKDKDVPLRGWLADWLQGSPPHNVWVGTSVEDQQRAEERIPELVEIPAVVRFLSCEPLLEEVDLGYWLGEPVAPQIDWVIVGGESGANARPFDAGWARKIRRECLVSSVAFFMKQMGGKRRPFPPIPAGLDIKQFPEPKHT